ncbi:MAG: glycine cleavage system protein GcvH [Candidatus Neomarinimicrobiota bacterium]|nr:MAG: glycine cleavage system protein GcvH [bacterium]|tara:strand:+ start:2050 stop:2427 length:378 start_codon:yes stop_codon:yes gene_type:complete
MSTPKELRYTKEHEWVSIDNNIATIGITDHAQGQLGDIVFVELPDLESSINQDDVFGVVEAVKTVADLFAPVSGKIIEINSDLEESPDLINSDPYESGWIIKTAVDNLDEYNNLMSNLDYEDFIK